MSELSFLIENQNVVQIDESFLARCQQSNGTDSRVLPSNPSKLISSKQLILNRNKNLITTKKKVGSPRSFNMCNSSEIGHQALSKLAMRVQALEENQKRMEKRIGVQFFQLKEEIQKRNQEQNDQFEEAKRIRGNLKDTKKNIAELLKIISQTK